MLKVSEVYDEHTDIDIEKAIQVYRLKGYVHYDAQMIFEDLKATYTSEYLVWTIMNDLVPYVLRGYKILYKPEPGAVPVLYKLEKYKDE